MTTTIDPSTTTPEPSAPAAAQSTPARKKRSFKWPGLGLVFAVGFLGLLTFMAIFADYLSFIPYPDAKIPGPNGRPGRYNWGPGWTAWFGTDGVSNDVFSKTIYGARTSLQVGVFATVFGIFVGGVLGVIAGYFRGWVDRVVMIITDCLLALPALLLAIILVNRLSDYAEDEAWLGWLSRKWQIVITLGILATAPLARIVRAQTLSLREREFVLAARSLGAKPGRVMFREILPNLIPAILTVAFTGLSILIAAEGALAFLGLGVEVGTPTWGKLIDENRNKIDESWWATIFPCLMLFLTVLSFNIIGDRLSRRFDIRQAGV
ncbi:MAG: ABC transporter permease [Acidimicrobiales bacterium]|nr:ABC transporter permease [Acidimicrobiales bacterium]MCB9393963.1 ABC transporter permease [Acidimicrobiaceae bacterium]